MKKVLPRTEKNIVPETPLEHFVVDLFKWGTVAAVIGVFLAVLYGAFLIAGYPGPIFAIIVIFLYFLLRYGGDPRVKR